MINKKLTLSILLMATCLSQFATDIYIPSLLMIAHDMKASVASVQLSVPIYLFGVAATQIIYGPLSEGVGRKKPLLLGLMVMLIGSIICIKSNSPSMLIIGRLIQGGGAGAAVCLWRSIFRDMFTGKDLSIYGGYLAIFITFIVPSAPLLGSFLIHYFKWQSTFIFMLIYSSITLICVFFWLKETHASNHISKLKTTYITNAFCTILKSGSFLRVTLITFLIYGTIFAWLTTGPVLLIKHVHILPSTFGWFNFLGCGIAYGLAGRINGKLVHKYGVDRIMQFGLVTVLISGMLLTITQLIFGITFWGTAIPVIFLYFGSSFIWPNAFSIAFSPFGNIAGYASAVYSLIQLSGGAIIGSLVTSLPSHTATPLGVVIIVAAAIAMVIQQRSNTSNQV